MKLDLVASPPRRTDAVPLVDLSAAHAEVAELVWAGMQRVVKSAAFVMGPDVSAFEHEFAAFTGVDHCIALSNGTDALELALRALAIGPGDEVLVPANTFIATASAVVRVGAEPVFVDVDPTHYLLDPTCLAARVTARTKAILPVHLFGQMAPMEAVNEFAAAHGLAVVEDFAQAQGARRRGTRAGAQSKIAATSFYPGKNLGAYGDAGGVVTNDPQLAAKVKNLRNYGSPIKYEHPQVGFNCRMDTLQAVVLRVKLGLLDEWNARRRTAAAYYDALLAGVEGVRCVPVLEHNEHIHHLYVVELTRADCRRNDVVARLNQRGIGAGIHYPRPLHLTGAFEHLGLGRGEYPVAEHACDHILSLPIYPQITTDQLERVVAGLCAVLASAAQ